MLYLFGKKIDLENSTLLYQDDFAQTDLSKNWELASGDWVVKDGWLEGKLLKNGGGLIYSLKSYDCNVLLDFKCRTIPPCDHDLNFSWASEGWNYQADDAGLGYIAGLGGWYDNKTGIERYPECRIHSMTQAFQVEAGRTYHVQAGSIDGHCFIFVDSKLIIEVFDPMPIDTSRYGRFGFGVYAGQAQFKDLKVYDINWSSREQKYIKD